MEKTLVVNNALCWGNYATKVSKESIRINWERKVICPDLKVYPIVFEIPYRLRVVFGGASPLSLRRIAVATWNVLAKPFCEPLHGTGSRDLETDRQKTVCLYPVIGDVCE